MFESTLATGDRDDAGLACLPDLVERKGEKAVTDKAPQTGQERTLISVKYPQDIRAWSIVLGCTGSDLQIAVGAVGPDADKSSHPPAGNKDEKIKALSAADGLAIDRHEEVTTHTLNDSSAQPGHAIGRSRYPYCPPRGFAMTPSDPPASDTPAQCTWLCSAAGRRAGFLYRCARR
jgi:hypothetical protein